MSQEPSVRAQSDANAAWAVLSSLLAGLLVWGGVGYLLGVWLGVAALFPVGLLVGATAATYGVYVRYGRCA